LFNDLPFWLQFGCLADSRVSLLVGDPCAAATSLHAEQLHLPGPDLLCSGLVLVLVLAVVWDLAGLQ